MVMMVMMVTVKGTELKRKGMVIMFMKQQLKQEDNEDEKFLKPLRNNSPLEYAKGKYWYMFKIM